MKLIQLIDCWRADDELFWNSYYFIAVKEFCMAKNIRGILKNLFKYYFLNIIVTVKSLVVWHLNITVNTTLKYCYRQALNKKLKLIGGTMKYFPRKLLGHKILRSMVSWATKFFFWKICKTLWPSPTYLMYAP